MAFGLGFAGDAELKLFDIDQSRDVCPVDLLKLLGAEECPPANEAKAGRPLAPGCFRIEAFKL